MLLYGGIDLHASSSHIGLIDGDRRRVMRRKLANDPELILNVLGPYEASPRKLGIQGFPCIFLDSRLHGNDNLQSQMSDNRLVLSPGSLGPSGSCIVQRTPYSD